MSARGSTLKPFLLERYFAEREFVSRSMLAASDCEPLTVGELLRVGGAERRLGVELNRLSLGYTEPQGAPSLREAIARIYTNVAPENILVHAGGEEAIFVFMHAALSAGDHVIVQTPCYQSLVEIPMSLGCRVTHWRMTEGPQWSLNVDDLPGLIESNTTAIVVNSPHNPTGFHFRGQEWTHVIDVARRHGLILLSDEAYRGLECNPRDVLPAACDAYEDAVSLGMTSKSLGSPGLRIAWAVVQQKRLRERMMQVKDYTTICCSGPSEFLAEVAIQNYDHLTERNRKMLRDNGAFLLDFMEEYDELFQWTKPDAGPVTFPQLTDDLSADELCERAFLDAGVLLLPGSVFLEGSNHIRIGFGRRGFPEALERLRGFLRSWRSLARRRP